MKITHLGHVAIQCSDYEKSLKFYTEIVGLKEKFSLYDNNGGIVLTYLEIVPGIFLELFTPFGVEEVMPYGDSTVVRHVCFWVKDIEAAGRELQDKGIDIFVGPTTAGHPWPKPFVKYLQGAGEYNFYISDPDGNEVEFMEYNKLTSLMTMDNEKIEELQPLIRKGCYSPDGYMAYPPDHPVHAYRLQGPGKGSDQSNKKPVEKKQRSTCEIPQKA